jgi:hypothetical protein
VCIISEQLQALSKPKSQVWKASGQRTASSPFQRLVNARAGKEAGVKQQQSSSKKQQQSSSKKQQQSVR